MSDQALTASPTQEAFGFKQDPDIDFCSNDDEDPSVREKKNQKTLREDIASIKYKRIIDSTMINRLSTLLSFLESHPQGASDTTAGNAADAVFRAITVLVPWDPREDQPPTLPKCVNDGRPVPTFSKLILEVLNQANRTVNRKKVQGGRRREVMVEELHKCIQRTRDSQARSAKMLAKLEKASLASRNQDAPLSPKDRGRRARASTLSAAPAASTQGMIFAQIRTSSYRSSYEFIASNPRILAEAEIYGLLLEALKIAEQQGDYADQLWQFTHQALLLQTCRLIGHGGIRRYFKDLTALGPKARQLFQKEVAGKCEEIRKTARKNAAELAPVERGIDEIKITI